MIRHCANILLSCIATLSLSNAQMSHGADHSKEAFKAVAVLHPTKGSSASGSVFFEKVENGVRITARISGLSPGKHGFHVHEYGDCSSVDGTSAGGHFNPAGMPHSGPMTEQRHIGDMGNIEAGKDSSATLDYVDALISLTGPHSIIGHAVIVHEKADDLTSQPTGDAGGRLACGVIGVRKN